jgi:hypothetical protein
MAAAATNVLTMDDSVRKTHHRYGSQRQNGKGEMPGVKLDNMQNGTLTFGVKN